jgi:hypothetical protein
MDAMQEQAGAPLGPRQLALLPELDAGPVPVPVPVLDPVPLSTAAMPGDVVRAMRRLFNRRWRQWHPRKRFEEVMADPVSRRLLYLAVTRRGWRGG